MKYALFVCVDPTGEPTDQDPTAWVDTWNDRGVRLEGMPLTHPADAGTVRVRGDEVLVTDGPFAELTEYIAGYDLLEAADLDEAIEVAASHPMAAAGCIEIRPVESIDLGPGTANVPHDGDAPAARFLALFRDDPDAPDSAVNRSDVSAWVLAGKASGRYLGGEHLAAAGSATTVRVRGGEPRLTPGPHADVPQQVSGLAFLDGSRDEAIEFLTAAPMSRAGIAELREFRPM